MFAGMFGGAWNDAGIEPGRPGRGFAIGAAAMPGGGDMPGAEGRPGAPPRGGSQ